MKKILYLIFCLLISKEVFCNEIKIEGKRPTKSNHAIYLFHAKPDMNHLFKLYEFPDKSSKVIEELKNKSRYLTVDRSFSSKYSGASRVISSREKSGDFYKVYYKPKEIWGWMHKDDFVDVGYIENSICSKSYYDKSFQVTKNFKDLRSGPEGEKIDQSMRQYINPTTHSKTSELINAKCLGGKCIKDRLCLNFEIDTYLLDGSGNEIESSKKTEKVWLSPFSKDGISLTHEF